MKKENKLILRAMKAALKVAEAAERIRVKNDTKYGTSSAMRPGGVVSPKTDTTAEPPTGKKPEGLWMDSDLKEYFGFDVEEFNRERIKGYQDLIKEMTERIIARDSEIQRLGRELNRSEQLANLLGIEAEYWKRVKPMPTYLVDFDKAETVLLDGLIGKMKPDSPSTEKTIEDFAGDYRSHVYSLIEKHLGIARTESIFTEGREFVHLKSPELGTETLVVLSPEGETLLKIVKDNSRKFEVR
jgi:hypothetical protein